MNKQYINCYMVRDLMLPIATKEMNYYSHPYGAKVIQIIKIKEDYYGHIDRSIVVVEMDGSYPFIEKQWEKFIEEVIHE